VKPLVTEVRKGCLSMTGFLVKPLVTEVRKGCLSMAGFLVKPLVTEVTETRRYCLYRQISVVLKNNFYNRDLSIKKILSGLCYF
jgi:hypothetical protein